MLLISLENNRSHRNTKELVCFVMLSHVTMTTFMSIRFHSADKLYYKEEEEEEEQRGRGGGRKDDTAQKNG